MLTVACVLKKVGDYNAEYVKILLKSVLRHSHEDIECICSTDTYAKNAVTLQNNWSGWWSKIELFKIPGPVVYFDLDTVSMESTKLHGRPKVIYWVPVMSCSQTTQILITV